MGATGHRRVCGGRIHRDRAGYLLSGMAPNGGGTKELGRDVNRTIGTLPPEQITKDLDAVAAFVAKLPACNGKVVVAGWLLERGTDLPLRHE